jgi:hypothetical protein
LRGLERYRGLPAALRTGGHGLRAVMPCGAALTFGLTRFAAFWLVLETLVVKEVLLAGGENEIRAAIYTLQDSILKL